MTRDGARIAVELTLTPVVLDGRTMVIAMVLDISRRRQQERELAMQRAALAHEINQPLAAILSNAQASLRFLGGSEPDLVEIRGGLVEIVDSAKRAGEVIRRLRAMLRNDPPELSSIDAREVIREILQILHSDLVDRHVLAVEAYADDAPPVRGDRVQLQQVLANLIVNAADAMTDVVGERRLTLSVQRHGDGVLIQVSDVGTGIDAADPERIFQAFVSSKPDGLGFGLPLCRTLVHARGGKLWASNNEGPGATFHVLLPAAE